ncbi:hypothetical protein ACFO3J_34235 [Streptomyces polygonati]|uniref:Uncharacterized protein n=1 Tax=Streptomyces polygonati TaxID=1617087 RepID=A0ABV8HZX6_9ACTN
MVDTQKVPHSQEPDTGVSPHCDLVTVPARQGLEAVDLLRFSPGGVGPVLHDRTGDSLAFLVPSGTADAWDVPGSSCVCRTEEGEAPGAGWLVPPHTDTEVTDPAVLEAALGEAARMLRLVDSCQRSGADGATADPADPAVTAGGASEGGTDGAGAGAGPVDR